ncbi:Multiple RNA-binding domain-containing protein 1 [Paramarasmius palmivorus]|uniref:Multiple RNA-binding domain-containing protein 1 n=1 Tax=Paramarasmius palmivorus TaxID=297713 RepID=A0AAW0D2R7_9AGAR
MSRLIVKNLPTYVTPARLQEHFQQKGAPAGILTDVKVARKPDGTSRRFGFVGFSNEKEALAAKEWFDKTFIDSTKINVAIVEGAKDAPTPRPNKRPRTEDATTPSDAAKAELKKARKDNKEDGKKSKKDSQMAEFLEVMAPKKGPSWANEAQTQPEASTSAKKIDDKDVDMVVPEEGLSDLDWMRRRMTSNVDEAEKAFEQSDEEEDGNRNANPTEIEPEEPKDTTKETILQTSRLFVRNLAFSCSEDDLQELFSPYGQISQVHIPLDPVTRQSKGLAYVTFVQPTDAAAAYEALDRKSFQGRLLHILGAVDRKGNVSVEDPKKRSVKDEKAAKRKAVAGKDFNWSMLYMNSDAVASSIADRMNIPKTSILNPDADSSDASTNPAVKLALAETHIINETKAYLESNGVVLSAFSSRARSDTTILVKNIPYGTSESQISELFEPHGTVTRVLVPPAGTIAVVDFDRPDEASKAFRAVAYRRLGNSVIYLEKAPLGIFSDTEPQVPTPGTTYAHAIKIPEQEAESTEDAEQPSLAAGTTLFVKNLAFSTTTERLMQVFRNLPSFAFARVQMKPDPKKPDGKLSMGYGFIGFKDVEGAKKAMQSMQGFVLDGHALHIKFAGRGQDQEEAESKGVGSKSRTTKIIVKNVPFEATKKDIRDLFGSHGHLKSVRLPKKFDSRTRGFAFLEFLTRHEAENAYNALKHTHLLGRHLVLEWAEEGEQDIDALRKKTGVGHGSGQDLPGRKRKLDMDIVGESQDVED